ncbi:MAG: hypothetical protein J5689_01965 [Clostridia bacterium]|nr:hypothetical protein [Clostridia bacterium]
MLTVRKGNYRNHEYYYCTAGYLRTPVVSVDNKKLDEEVVKGVSGSDSNIVLSFVENILICLKAEMKAIIMKKWQDKK